MRRWNRVVMVVWVIGLLTALGVPGALAQDGDDEEEFTYAGTVNAPDFPADADWINTSEPISLLDLRGKIVVLDFWTYGCINCIHVIPDLKRLEREYPDSLVVIGVHSAKFENEGETENIRRIVRRYEVEHPVVNDADFEIWSQYAVRAWPTFMVIDPNGKVVGQLSGEPLYPRLQPILETMVAEYGAAGELNPEPLPQWQPELATYAHTAPLRFPGKVLTDAESNRLFIADSNNNRIVIAALDSYEVQDVIGTGKAGLTDGDFETAEFFRPQGLTLADSTLYVADTANHAIRAVDLDARSVTTVAGTGEQGFNRDSSGPGLEMTLNSPWDLVAHESVLYIAMAGPHQLWSYDTASGVVGPYAGSGREALVDGALDEAALNQPSGIDTDGEVLYFADAEASAIRTADLDPDGNVTTIVGTGLFDFGDVDGTGDEVLLQHPLGITVSPDGLLFVADTYNNKIKRIDPATRESVTFLGTGEEGFDDGEAAQFYEPGGIDYADGKLYVADTNNHAIRVVDLDDNSVTTIEFPNAEVLTAINDAAPAASAAKDFDETFGASELMQRGDATIMPAQNVSAGEGTILIYANMPEGYKLNDQAPFTALWPETDEVAQIPDEYTSYREVLPELPVAIPATFQVGQTELSVDLTIYWCEAVNESLCFVDRSTLIVPLTVTTDTTDSTVTFQRELVPPIIEDTLG